MIEIQNDDKFHISATCPGKGLKHLVSHASHVISYMELIWKWACHVPIVHWMSWISISSRVTMNRNGFSIATSSMVIISLSGYIVTYPEHGANVGPIWGRQDRGGPHVGPIFTLQHSRVRLRLKGWFLHHNKIPKGMDRATTSPDDSYNFEVF